MQRDELKLLFDIEIGLPRDLRLERISNLISVNYQYLLKKTKETANLRN